MPRLSSFVRTLRALPIERRTELLVRIESAGDHFGRVQRRRHAEIIKRQIFGAEPAARVRTALRLSPEQFRLHRVNALRHAATLLEQSALAPAVSSSMQRRVQALLAQARTLFGLGLSEQALGVLHDVSEGGLDAHEHLETTVLTIDALEDIGKLDRLPRVAERARALLAAVDPVSAEHRIATVTADWALASLCYQRGDRAGFVRARTPAIGTLLELSEKGDRDAALALCRMRSRLTPVFVPWDQAQDELNSTQELVKRFNLPIAFEAELRAHRAYIYSQEAATAPLAQPELELAHALAVDHAPLRILWLCFCLDVFESIYRGDNRRAVESAETLYESVRDCESVEWKQLAATRLVNAYLKMERYADAERVVSIGEEMFASLGMLFGRCVILCKQGRYQEGFALANELITSGELDRPRTTQLRANVLVYRAQLAYRLGNLALARRDVREAIAIYESYHAVNVVFLRSAYNAAYTITGRTEYRDRAVEMARMPSSKAPAPSLSPGVGLTARQREIAGLAAEGATNREIAEHLGISHRTVGNHLEAVFMYFGIHGRRHLAGALRKEKGPTRLS